MTFSLFSPLILLVATVFFALLRVNLRYRLSYTSATVADTRGELYFESVFALRWSVLIMQLGAIGVFLLKTDLRQLSQNVLQVAVIFIGLYFTSQWHRKLEQLFRSVVSEQEGVIATAVNGPERTSKEASAPASRFDEDETDGEDFVASALWVPRDSLGYSDALVAFVRAHFFSRYTEKEGITNAHAAVDTKGKVTLNDVPNRDRRGAFIPSARSRR